MGNRILNLRLWLLLLEAHLTVGLQYQQMRSNQTGPGAMKDSYPFYHTSEELRAEVAALAKNCDGATLTVETHDDPEVSIDVITVRHGTTDPVNRVFMLFGEHARELISPESGLGMLRRLCGQDPTPDGAPDAADVLKTSMFRLVLNANPRSRLEVEQGNYCTRTSPTGVDLNRNWDEKWAPADADEAGSSDTYPGPSPFSEPETKLFKKFVEDYKPTTFMTIHSGTYGMYMPWAFDMEHLADRNQKKMLDMLKNIDADHCQCPFGAAGKEVGYSCPGTCLDWIYDQANASFSFAYEIYTSPENVPALRDRWKEKMDEDGMALLQEGQHLGHDHFADFFGTHTSDFVQRTSPPSDRIAMDRVLGARAQKRQPFEDDCFRLFNPETEDTFQETVQNWATVFLLTASQAAEEIKKNA